MKISGKPYEDYYLQQAGNGLPAFAGSSFQKGHGVGNLLKGLWRYATPLLKKAGKQALKTGISVVASGIMNPSSVKKRSNVQRRRKTRPSAAGSSKTPSPRTRKAQLAKMNFKSFSPLNSQTGSGKIKRRKPAKRSGKRKTKSRDIFK